MIEAFELIFSIVAQGVEGLRDRSSLVIISQVEQLAAANWRQVDRCADLVLAPLCVPALTLVKTLEVRMDQVEYAIKC